MLEPLLPKGTKPGCPPIWTRRQLIDGIRFRVRTGVPWRDMPKEYGPWGRAYDMFRRWQRNGAWQRILTQRQARPDAQDLITWGEEKGELQKELPGGVTTEPDDHGLGRSCGGLDGDS
ncbi:transposase [Streptomyces sp. NPDC048254]|uniref:transposase n=1 Tax=Streptomyces sp. NPDC048254 TaxID=3365525 RepID=UPI003724145A